MCIFSTIPACSLCRHGVLSVCSEILFFSCLCVHLCLGIGNVTCVCLVFKCIMVALKIFLHFWIYCNIFIVPLCYE